MVKIVIIGAGIAGLAAAEKLVASPKKPEVVIYEASNRIGGRAWTVALDGEPMDWGAEALEAGPDAPTAMLYKNKYGTIAPDIKYPWPEELYTIPQHGSASNIASNVDGANKTGNGVMTKNIEAMQAYIKGEVGPIPSDNVAFGVDAKPGYSRISALMSGYGPFAESSVLGQSSAFDRAQSELLQEADDSSSDTSSVHSSDSSEDEPHTVYFSEGIGATVMAWAKAKGLDKLVTYDMPITMLKNNSGKVTVTPKLKKHTAENVDYVIVTVPTDVIYSGKLTINDLSGDEMGAFRSCPLGFYHKVAVTGLSGISKPAKNSRFYVTGERMEDLYYIAHSPGGKYCMAHIAGETAAICNKNPGYAENMLYNTLKKLNPKLSGSPVFYHSDWHSNEYIGGAYSYCQVDRIGARAVLEGLVVGNIYFAGEACSRKWYGQLAGAMDTGQKAAAAILAKL